MVILVAGFLYLMGLLTMNRSVIVPAEQNGDFLTNAQYFIMAIGTFAFLIGAYALSIRNFKVRPSRGFILFGALFLCSALVPIIYGIIFEGTSSLPYILRHVSYALLMVGGVVFMLSCLPKVTNGNYVYSLVAYGVIIVTIIACIYSYITETEMYTRIFVGDFPEVLYGMPESFLGNRNTFAWLLLLGQISLCYLETRKGHLIHWILILYFWVNQVFLISKTGLILSTVLTVFFLIYRFVEGVKHSPIRTFILFSSCLLGLIILFLALELALGDYFNQLLNYVAYILSRMPQASRNSLQVRLDYFMMAYNLISSSSFTKVFGYGYYHWQEVWFSVQGVGKAMDVTWGVNILENGFMGVILSCLIWLYVLFTIIKAMKRRMKGGPLILFVYLMFVARSFIEVNDFVNLNMFGILLYFFTYLPCASHMAKREYELSKDPLAEKFPANPYPKTPSLARIYAWFTPVFALLIAFSELFMARFVGGASCIYLLLSLSIAYIFAPFLGYGYWCGLRKGKAFSAIAGIVFSILYLLFAVMLPILLHDLLSLMVPLLFLLIGVGLFIYCSNKEDFNGIWGTWIRCLLEMALIGGGFFLLLHFYEGIHNAFCLGFVAIDIIILSYVADCAIFKGNDSIISYYEGKLERLAYKMEVVEVAGFFMKKEKREEKFAELNIYNV